MTTQTIIFLASVLTVAFAYLGYPLLVWLLVQVWGKPLRKSAPIPRAVSIVIACHNEAENIARRIAELQELLRPLSPESEIIIVSDGSTDGTERIAAATGALNVRVIQQPRNMGKAMALNAGVLSARNPIVVFGDSRQAWAPDAIEHMLDNYGDLQVGAVSGDLVLTSNDGSLAGVGLYWKLEKWIRLSESRLHSSVQVSGAICSVRRELFVSLEPGMILDDMAWPQSVAMQGYRVIHEPLAQAFDHLPEKPRDEMRRKIRTLAGNLQLLVLRPAIILPWRNPVWFAVICHKLLRLVVPWAMLTALVASAVSDSPVLRVALVAQLAGYTLGVGALFAKRISRLPLASTISSLLVLNAAAFMAWFVFFSGRSGRSWSKVRYSQPATLPAGSST